MLIPPDVQEFLDEYPDVVDDPTSRANFEFYSNNIRCSPDNRTIEEIHERYLLTFCCGHVPTGVYRPVNFICSTV